MKFVNFIPSVLATGTSPDGTMLQLIATPRGAGIQAFREGEWGTFGGGSYPTPQALGIFKDLIAGR